ncbi:MAG: SBBP repeat-containing protein [Bacteroidia bacterium]
MKSKLTLLIILLSVFFIYEEGNAQAPAWLWAKSAGGTDNDEGHAITTDAAGNVLVTGYYSSATITFGATTLTNAGGSDVYVVKYDAAGNVLWAKSGGGASTDNSKGIATDTSGNVLIIGTFGGTSATFGTITLTNTTALASDVFIVKYDASGNVLWAKSAGGTNSDYGTGIATDASGNVVATGYFQSASITFGATTLTNAGAQDIFVVKYDASGNLLWAKAQGGTSYDNGNSITTDTSGNVLVTGWFQSASVTFGTVTLTNTTSGSNDIFIVKYDALGNVLWAKSAGGTLVDNPTGITTDAGANVLLTGYFQSGSITFGTITLNNIGSQDIFVVKYDAAGNEQWAKVKGGSGSDYGYAISADASGNALVTGYFDSPSITFGTTVLTNAGVKDVFVAKFDAAGNVLGAASAGGTGNDEGLGISTDASGNVLVTGRFSSPSIAFGTTTLTNAGIYDVFVSKLTFCVTTTTVNAVACYSYTSPSGNYNWTTSGAYHDTLTNVSGCDSIMTINLTINNPDTSITQSGITLTSNATTATYQWLDCNSGNAAINGATSQSFTPAVDGSYAVAITQNGCTDTSSCYIILGTGIHENSHVNNFTIAPNPSTGQISITNSKVIDDVTITNPLGQVVYQSTPNDNHVAINIKDDGIYFVTITSDKKTATGKIIVQY